MDTIKLMLVDDHEVVRAGYHRLLESNPGINVVDSQEHIQIPIGIETESRSDVALVRNAVAVRVCRSSPGNVAIVRYPVRVAVSLALVQDAIGLALGLGGAYWDDGARESVQWKTHRTLLGLFMFILVGLLAGMFGLGAGWANVPVLNLLMGAPLKAARLRPKS